MLSSLATARANPFKIRQPQEYGEDGPKYLVIAANS
jgi:hypothetical protein